ncbi:MAG: outer membrane beta-barrel protein [Bacteroidales bacterium]|nr:outer membrane beta-barrel protein [Bacteroidales bacterium]
MAFYGQIEGRFSSSNKNFKPINYTKVKKNNNNYTKNSPIQKLIKYNEQKDFFYLTGNLGASILQGDSHYLLEDFRPMFEFNLGGGYQFSEYLGVEARLGYSSFDQKFDQLEVQEINGFKGSLDLTFNLTNLLFGYSPSRRFHVVPHIGLGQIHYKSHVYHYKSKTFIIIGDGEDGANGINGRKIIGMVIGGVRFDYSITSYIKLNLNIESTRYDSDLLDCNLGLVLGSSNDWSSSVTLGVSYVIGKKTGNSNKKIYSPCE